MNSTKYYHIFSEKSKWKSTLFRVSPKQRGKGIGKRLIQYGIEHYSINEVTVNEQNPQAVGFYEHLGFEIYRRTDFDEEGNPYSLLYMKLQNI